MDPSLDLLIPTIQSLLNPNLQIAEAIAAEVEEAVVPVVVVVVVVTVKMAEGIGETVVGVVSMVLEAAMRVEGKVGVTKAVTAAEL